MAQAIAAIIVKQVRNTLRHRGTFVVQVLPSLLALITGLVWRIGLRHDASASA